MKKIISAGLSVAMLFSLAACGAKEPTKTPDLPVVEEVVVEEQKPIEKPDETPEVTPEVAPEVTPEQPNENISLNFDEILKNSGIAEERLSDLTIASSERLNYYNLFNEITEANFVYDFEANKEAVSSLISELSAFTETNAYLNMTAPSDVELTDEDKAFYEEIAVLKENAVKAVEDFKKIISGETLEAADIENIVALNTLYKDDVDMANILLQTFMDAEGNSLQVEDMKQFSVTASMMMTQAFGIAIIDPVEGREEAVKTYLQNFIDLQNQNFEMYLQDQKVIAENAILETLDNGLIVMVMVDNQDVVFENIKNALK